MAGPVGIESFVGPRSGGIVYDENAADYFSRRESLAGGFASAGYTAAQAKSFFNDWYVAAKDFGVWDVVAEMYFLVGGTFDGINAKGKYLSSLTLRNVGSFVAADYTADGVGAGLQGNGTKHWGTNTLATDTPPGSGIGGYVVTAASTATGGVIGASGQYHLVRDSSTNRYFGRHKSNTVPNFWTSVFTGPVTINRQSQLVSAKFFNRSTSALFGDTYGAVESGEIFLMARGSAFQPFLDKMAAGWQLIGASDQQVQDLHTITNNLMTAFGANVY